MSYANKKKIYVATYKEILIGFIIFCIILVILYPKDTLTKQVLSEQSNYDLSVLYLKDMLKNDPSNETLMLSLAKQAFKANKKDLSFKLLALLRNSKNTKTKEDAYRLSYKIAKEDYFYLKTKNKTQEMQKKYAELKQIFHHIITQKFYTESEIEKLYKESYFLHDKKTSYFLLQKLLTKNPNDLKLLQDAFYLSYDLKNYEQSMLYLDKLTLKDKRNSTKWLDERYYLLLKHYSFKDAESFIISHAQNSVYWKKRLVSFYLQHKKYKKVAQLYMNDFHHSSSYKERKELWLKAIKTLQAGGYNKDAVRLAYRYENYFIKDKEARITLLKLYISANDLKKANRLSKKVLKMER